MLSISAMSVLLTSYRDYILKKFPSSSIDLLHVIRNLIRIHKFHRSHFEGIPRLWLHFLAYLLKQLIIGLPIVQTLFFFQATAIYCYKGFHLQLSTIFTNYFDKTTYRCHKQVANLLKRGRDLIPTEQPN